MTELFYIIADADSATARRSVVERGLDGKVRFRNLDYPEVTTDFQTLGGKKLPALWDGERLHEGLPAVLAELDKLSS